MKTKRYYQVRYFSPGTFMPEESSYNFDYFNLKEFCSKSSAIMERHNARPYGFWCNFLEMPEVIPNIGGFKVSVEPKILESTGIYFITGELIFYHDVKDNPEFRIMASKMRMSESPIAIKNSNSYVFYGVFGEKDFILNQSGEIIRSGSDADLVDYRKNCKYE